MKERRREDPFPDSDCYQVLRSRGDGRDLFTVRHYPSRQKADAPVCCEVVVDLPDADRVAWVGDQRDLEGDVLARANRIVEARHGTRSAA